MLIVLIAASLLAFLASQSLPQIFAASPAMWAHVALAVGVMTLITAAMQHFVPVLARTRGAGKWMARLPWLMMAAGVIAVAVFAGVLLFFLVQVAAGVALIGAIAMVWWMRGRAASALGKPHPGLQWYVAAMACLGLALFAALLLPWLPQWHVALRAFHLHLNLYGFVALTAVGTLQVLLPTAAGQPDPHAALRLRQDLKWALLGAFCIALGAAVWPALSWLGALAWAWVLGRMVWAWRPLFSVRLVSLHGAEPVLLAAVLGLCAAMLGAVLGDFSSLQIFLPAFLMPLVTGAAGVLAPVWLNPTQIDKHLAGRSMLNRWAGVRALLFLSAGVLPLLGYQCSGMPALIALFWFGAVFVIWLWRQS